MRDRSENFFFNDIYPVKKYVLQISVGYKRKEDSSMEEMQTKEKQIVYDQALYEKAYEFAKKKHGTQKRIGGDPYITHPVAVANILKKEGYDIEYLIVALFHDLLEDTDATEDEIRSIAGEEVLQAVKLLTKEKGYDMQTYVTRIRQNPIAYAVKGADRLHNLRTASCTSRHFRQKYITETETWYLSFRPDIPAEVEKLKQTLTDENTDNRFSQASSE